MDCPKSVTGRMKGRGCTVPNSVMMDWMGSREDGD